MPEDRRYLHGDEEFFQGVFKFTLAESQIKNVKKKEINKIKKKNCGNLDSTVLRYGVDTRNTVWRTFSLGGTFLVSPVWHSKSRLRLVL